MEWTHGELGTGETGQPLHGIHRQIPMLLTVGFHKIGKEQGFIPPEFRRHLHQHGDSLFVGHIQRLMQTVANMLAAGLKLTCVPLMVEDRLDKTARPETMGGPCNRLVLPD